MTDFSELKTAAEEIKLDDLQKQKILNACKNKKRKRINQGALTAVAAVFIATVVLFSPTLFHVLNPAGEKATNDAAAGIGSFGEEEIFDINGGEGSDYQYYAGEMKDQYAVDYSQSLTALNYTVFDAEGFRSIYSVVPRTFYELVGFEVFNEWAMTVSAENGMAIVQFIEHFGITRTEFENANRRYADIIRDIYGIEALTGENVTAETQELEIFNTDIVYSGNRTKTDEYYCLK